MMQLNELLLLVTLALAGVSAGSAAYYEWHVTRELLAIDCYIRSGILVNGKLHPTLEVHHGETLHVNVFNNLPAESAQGLSLHWHGWALKGQPWQDGTPFIAQCPIPPGSNYTYAIKVLDPPGTYWWHDHGLAGEGLHGPLIVHAAEEDEKQVYGYAEERTMLLTDWVPEADRRSQNGLGPSVLVNGKGVRDDCWVKSQQEQAAQSALDTAVAVCKVKSILGPHDPQSINTASRIEGCTHEVIPVEQRQTYRIRIINAGGRTYKTVCFQEHNLTVIAADAVPIIPYSVGHCVDVNVGQRLDVLLSADQPVDNYWISVHPQYSTTASQGYALLNYNSSPAVLPNAPIMQPGSIKTWSLTKFSEMRPTTTSVHKRFRQVPASADILVRITAARPAGSQEESHEMHHGHSIDGVPQCSAALDFMFRHPEQFSHLPGSTKQGEANSSVWVVDGRLAKEDEGDHIISVQLNDVVDIVLQNLDDTKEPAADGQQPIRQYPYHLHGNHFWVLGAGSGLWDPFTSPATYDTVNPPLRDTATILSGGWLALRFQATNPGAWPFHCHISPHVHLGDGLLFVVAPDQLPAPPATAPTCQCTTMDGHTGEHAHGHSETGGDMHGNAEEEGSGDQHMGMGEGMSGSAGAATSHHQHMGVGKGMSSNAGAPMSGHEHMGMRMDVSKPKITDK